MQSAYREKKDLYAVIGAACFHNNYEDNLEFHPVTGVLQPDGKERRSKAKTVLLGTMYGMSAKTLAERMNLSVEEGQKIIDDFYAGFPGIKKFTEESQAMLKKYGYITDIFGRRRHIPDGMLPEYEVKYTGASYDFNPLLNTPEHVDSRITALMESYKKRLEGAKWKSEKDTIIAEAKAKGFTVKNNNGFISRAMRQCLNARIQGSAASMTKLAMVMINKDEELNRLGFRLQVAVHDEVFGECPTENSEAVGNRLCQIMVDAAKTKCDFTPWSVDPYMVKAWYEDECTGGIKNDYNKLLKKMSETEAFEEIKEKYSMFREEGLRKVVEGTYEVNTSDINLLK